MTRPSQNKTILSEVISRQAQRKKVVFTWEHRFQQLYTDCEALINFITDLRTDLIQTKKAHDAFLLKNRYKL